ncbi:MAG: UDP-N-acetylmuramoyl-L-alanyl-D-glutamate--2,6-diaminopimelate ligase [Clostridia bacterium]|nr:UDP-N-acetylmuramoyl-L-alanyl-D-glutamate--2,6-diaminopimelate ligase [Clostridia bacterium]
MKLKDLIKKLEVIKIIGSTDVEVTELKIDSNAVTKGCAFICIKGKDFDGHEYIRQVEKFGAVAIFTQNELQTSLTQIIVKDTRAAMCVLASTYYGGVDKKMKLIAVLGTNGKTTTTHLIKNILENAGRKCGVIGTLGAFYAGKVKEPSLTTPDPIELHKTLADMYACGVRTVVMEVSAHAVYWGKVNGLKFQVAVFTNFTQDHLDFFGDMETYKQAKLKFFNDNECNFIVTNSDDTVGREILSMKKGALAYGVENPSDVFAIDIKSDANGSTFIINLFDCVYDVSINLIGKFNVYNALAAVSACSLIGVSPKKAVDGLIKADVVSGRLEKIYDGNFSVYIDYAHTPDGLEKSLLALRPIVKGRLISLFGCGGNRDKSKREIMGAVSAKNADFTIITSDNPRYEEPMEIINEIEKGVLLVNKNYIAIEDREDAIKYALDILKPSDALLIAGKGSEKYQEILGIKKLYNDKDTVIEYLRRKLM